MRTTNTTVITTKGQTTIPKRIREYLGVRPRDRVEFKVKEGVVTLKRAVDLDSNFGSVKPRKRPEDFHAVRQSFERQMGRRSAKKT